MDEHPQQPGEVTTGVENLQYGMIGRFKMGESVKWITLSFLFCRFYRESWSSQFFFPASSFVSDLPFMLIVLKLRLFVKVYGVYIVQYHVLHWGDIVWLTVLNGYFSTDLDNRKLQFLDCRN